jgi:hypothetical protein
MSLRVRGFASSEDDLSWGGRRLIISLWLREKVPEILRVRRIASLCHVVSLPSGVR